MIKRESLRVEEGWNSREGRERKMCKGTHLDGGGRESFIIEKGEDW